MEERSLEIDEVLGGEGEEGDDGDRKQVYTYFGKRFAKVYLVCLIMSLSLSWRQLKIEISSNLSNLWTKTNRPC